MQWWECIFCISQMLPALANVFGESGAARIHSPSRLNLCMDADSLLSSMQEIEIFLVFPLKRKRLR